MKKMLERQIIRKKRGKRAMKKGLGLRLGLGLIAVLLSVATCLLLSAAISVQAQVEVPPYIEYQGRLSRPVADINARGLKGEHTLVFSIWTDKKWGDKLWWETHVVDTTKTDGNYRVILGTINPLKNAILFTSQPLYIEMVMDGEDVYPRTEVVSVPYALKAEDAKDAQTVGGYAPADLKPDHQWSDTALRFEKPDSTWGDLVELKGAPGADGKDGAPGADGKDGTPGADGKDGAKGGQGDIGPQGIQGETGATGPQGEVGPQGPAGPGLEIPAVTSISPNNAELGYAPLTVTIGGDDFQFVSQAMIGGTALTNENVTNKTSMTATVPAGITDGTYDVSVSNVNLDWGTGSKLFTVNIPVSSVSAISPNKMVGLDYAAFTATITGTNFISSYTQARIGTTDLTDETVASATSMTATVPAGITDGSYNVSVSNNDLDWGTAEDLFTVMGYPFLTWSGTGSPSTHTEGDCTAEGGTVHNTGATGTICKFTAPNVTVPVGWAKAAQWQSYSPASWGGDSCGRHPSYGPSSFLNQTVTLKSRGNYLYGLCSPNLTCSTWSGWHSSRWFFLGQVGCVQTWSVVVQYPADQSTYRYSVGCY